MRFSLSQGCVDTPDKNEQLWGIDSLSGCVCCLGKKNIDGAKSTVESSGCKQFGEGHEKAKCTPV